MAGSPVNTDWNVNPNKYGAGKNQRTFIVPAGGTPTANAEALQAYYDFAKTLTPAIGNRILIIVPPGNYNLAGPLVMDTDYIDVQGFGSARYNRTQGEYLKPETLFTAGHSNWLVRVTARDIRLSNVAVENISAVGAAIQIDNVYGADRSRFTDIYAESNSSSPSQVIATPDSGIGNQEIASYFENVHTPGPLCKCDVFSGEAHWCSGGDQSFASTFTGSSAPANCSGKLYHCIAGANSFGSTADDDGEFSGYAEWCEAGTQSFGHTSENVAASAGIFSGIARHCTAGHYSFGGTNSAGKGEYAFTGEVYDCVALNYSFGYGANSEFNGHAERCKGGSYCFGVASMKGTLVDCVWQIGNSIGDGGRVINCRTTPGLTGGGLSLQHANTYVEGCQVRGTSNAMSITTNGPCVFNCTLVSDSGTYGIVASGTPSATITHCRMNLGIDPNITNYEATPCNVVNVNVDMG